jgi:D-beta-D-heptose 7-phosphate kinase/D-beta-D-heptose 1-phosphate adenosyltransferase
VVFANGCFDLLHAGHIRFLEAARRQGDRLVVAVNEDASVRRLKGLRRPILPAWQRAELIAALESVDLVVRFPELRVSALLKLLRPDVFVKGGDYTRKTVNQAELALLERHGGRLVILPMLRNSSSSRIIARITGREQPPGKP